jgi:hypothetical protein
VKGGDIFLSSAPSNFVYEARITWNGKTFAQMTDQEREQAAAEVERELQGSSLFQLALSIKL